MPNHLWHEWLAVMEMEHDTDRYLIQQVALLTSVTYNIAIKKGTPLKSHTDFMPDFGKRTKTIKEQREEQDEVDRQHIALIRKVKKNGRND